MSSFFIYIDGGARGNPGPAGAGVVVADQKGQKIASIKRFLGHRTNNQAEYEALLLALDWLKKQAPELTVKIFLDSELLQKQLTGSFRVKEHKLKVFHQRAQEKLKTLREFPEFVLIPRAQNKAADKLVNLAIDKAKND